MRKMRTILIVVIAACLILIANFGLKNLSGNGPSVKKAPGDRAPAARSVREGHAQDFPLTVHPGFGSSIFAEGLEDPRVMVLDPHQTLLVSIPRNGRVVALPDKNGDGAADEIVTVAGGLKRPHGLAFRCAPDCKLYIAEENAVNVFSYNPKTFKAVKEKKICDLPAGGFHVTRTLLFLPKPHDDTLLISVGSSCNVCKEKDRRRAKILAVPAEGGKVSTFASGLRNSVFMTVHPRTRAVWVTEMGRDMLGDDLPPDEINIVQQGRNYGWPYCYGKNVHDDDFDPHRKHQCREPETYPSFLDISAHSAPLGLAFFYGKGWPEEFNNDLLVAYHGSWNRSIPTGYKIVRYILDQNGSYLRSEDFAWGWLTADNSAWGRPADILIEPGSIFVSDDKAGVIYRITRK